MKTRTNHASMRSSITALFRPRSIAIAGASSDPGKLGSLPLAFLQKNAYKGRIYPINPKGGEINGLRSYARMGDIQDPVDLLVIAVAAPHIPALLRECAPGQIKAAIILSSGYAELGPEGIVLQRELWAQAQDKGIRFIGPNSVGLANLWDNVIPSISQVYDEPELRPGPIAFVSQSGAMGTAVTALTHAERLGIGYFVSTGNEGDLEFSDFCDYFVDDPSVTTIAGYLEGVRDGRKFIAAVKRASEAGKPVILLKVGTTEVGGVAIRSHTGALAGEEKVYDAVFRDTGVVRAESLEQLVDYLKIFSSSLRSLPATTHGVQPRVAILSHSGGAGVLTADSCVQKGIAVPKPSGELAARLASSLPSYASLQNPIDMTATVIFDPERMTSIVRDTVQSGEYDAAILCVNLIWRQGEKLAERLIDSAPRFRRLFAVTWIASKQDPINLLNAHGIPVYPDPVRCANAVSARLKWEVDRLALIATPSPDLTSAQSLKEDLRRYAGQTELFQRYEIPLVPSILTKDPSSARRAAIELGYPVAAKLVSPDLPHKSDVGGVILDIETERVLNEAYSALTEIHVAEREGVLIQRMVSGQCELFAGAKRDPIFGPIVVFGLGGIYVELLKTSVVLLAPLSVAQARTAIERTNIYPLLAGARGQKAVNVEAVAAIVSRLSYLAAEQHDVVAVDLNPILASAEGAIVVDAKVEATPVHLSEVGAAKREPDPAIQHQSACT